MSILISAALSAGAIAGIVIAVVFVLALPFILAFAATLFFLFPHRYTYDYIDIESTMEDISREWYESLPVEKIKVKSQYGYDLSCNFLEGTKKDRMIVFVHGYTYNIVGSMKYIKRFMDLGYNIFFYDHTACGESGGKMSTFGVHESNDLGTVVKYIRNRWGQDVKIGLHGESMGAATSILYAARDPKISFVMEDCGYSCAYDEIMAWGDRMPILKPIIKIATVMAGWIAGCKIDEANPLKVLQAGGCKDMPMFFAHGDADQKTPVRMVTELYDAKQGVKQILIVKDARHARCITKDPVGYMNAVKEFLKKTDFNY